MTSFSYTCPRCLFETDKKFNFKRHINKKTLCKLEKYDIIPKKYESMIMDVYKNNLINQFFELNEKIKIEQMKNVKLNHYISKLENENKKLKKQCIKSISVKGKNNTVIVNNIHVEVNNFTNTNNDILTPQTILSTLKNTNDKNDVRDTLLSLFGLLYMNDKYPENHSIIKTNLKNDLIKYYNNKKWEIGDEKDIILKALRYNIYPVIDTKCNSVRHLFMNTISEIADDKFPDFFNVLRKLLYIYSKNNQLKN